MLIFTGFYAFYAACAIYKPTGPWMSIYDTPMTLGSVAFTVTMGFSGGVVAAFIVAKGDPYWTISGGLAGMISIASGVDIYHPALGYLIAMIGAVIAVKFGALLEKMKVDDAVGAVAVHGGAGLWSMLAVGIFASGYPQHDKFTSIQAQLIGIVVMAALGFIPGYTISFIMKKLNLLRVPREDEIEGLDLSELEMDGLVPAGSSQE